MVGGVERSVFERLIGRWSKQRAPQGPSAFLLILENGRVLFHGGA